MIDYKNNLTNGIMYKKLNHCESLFIKQLVVSLAIIVAVLFSTTAFAQRVETINYKGTKISSGNTVIESATAPTTPAPIEGDIWFDTTTNLTKVWDGDSWEPIQASTASSLWDTDRDTGIQVEESTDEDVIRFDTGDVESASIRANTLTLPQHNSIIRASRGLILEEVNDQYGALQLSLRNRNAQHGVNIVNSSTIINVIDFRLQTTAFGANSMNSFIRAEGRSGPSRLDTPELQIAPQGNINLVVADESAGFLRGNVVIGPNPPAPSAALDIQSNTSGVLFPHVPLTSLTDVTTIATPAHGLTVFATGGALDEGYYYYDTDAANAGANAGWKPIQSNITVTDELIFDGEDDPSGTYDDYYYLSMVINGDWKVVRYDKTDVNAEAEATIANNSGVTAQPTTLAACITLTF